MKWNTKSSLALIAGFAMILPTYAFARTKHEVRNFAQLHRQTAQIFRPDGDRARRNHPPVFSNNQRYNRSNNFGGLWVDRNAHPDWRRDREHFHNNHRYRWYENGWLIIDAGFDPYRGNPKYSGRASIPARVQMRLADQRYYNGAIDGNIGPGSRRAIASYQNDHGLMVTGRIDDSLMRSLRLE